MNSTVYKFAQFCIIGILVETKSITSLEFWNFRFENIYQERLFSRNLINFYRNFVIKFKRGFFYKGAKPKPVEPSILMGFFS